MMLEHLIFLPLQGDKHEYNEFKHKVAQLVNFKKNMLLPFPMPFSENEKGGFNLLRAYRGLPRNS